MEFNNIYLYNNKLLLKIEAFENNYKDIKSNIDYLINDDMIKLKDIVFVVSNIKQLNFVYNLYQDLMFNLKDYSYNFDYGNFIDFNKCEAVLIHIDKSSDKDRPYILLYKLIANDIYQLKEYINSLYSIKKIIKLEG